MKFLNSFKITCSEKIVGTLLEDHVEIWIEITDRGGLVKANQEFYSFVPKTEEVTRSFMTVGLLKKNQKEDMVEIFKVKLKTIPEVSAIRDSLSRKMPSRQLSDKLFKQIIKKAIDLRAYAFVTAFV